METDNKKSFNAEEYLEKISGGERFVYKLLRVLGWICVVFGVFFIFPAFEYAPYLLFTAFLGGIGIACFPIANFFLKKVSSPEYREQRELQIATNKAAMSTLGAFTRDILNPGSSIPEDEEENEDLDEFDEDFIEEEDENEDEDEDEDEDIPAPVHNTAEHTVRNTTITNGGTTMIKKSVASIKAHVGSISDAAAAALPDIVSSMTDDEVILHAFTSMMLERNPGRPGRDSATNIINILTNKRYYFAGTDGQSTILFAQQKSGSVALRDVHATNSGTITMQGAYVGFETRNDDYKIWLGAGVKSGPIKAWFDEAIRKAQESETRGTTIQAALSPADEIKKFKELLDLGIITQEEFDAKKKQLLGL